MYRVISCAAVLLSAVVSAVAADDRDNCFNVTGQTPADESIAACNRMLARTPKDVIVYYHRGQAYESKGDHDRAITDLDQAIGFRPDLAAAYTSRGFVYNRKGDFDRAIADFDQAIKLEPDHAARAYNNRGFSYGQKGDYERA